MANEIKVQNSSSIGFLSLLTLIFVIAKIGGWIDWSWWLVFAPVLAPIGIVAAVLLFLGAAAVILAIKGR